MYFFFETFINGRKFLQQNTVIYFLGYCSVSDLAVSGTVSLAKAVQISDDLLIVAISVLCSNSVSIKFICLNLGQKKKKR